MKKLFGYLFFAFGLTLLLAACSTGNAATQKRTERSGAITVLNGVQHDWGDIDIQGGNVTKTFRMKNESELPLRLIGAQTSCMCTTVQYSISDDLRSPVFGMHRNSDWNRTVAPGAEFDVTVTFDPLAHGPDAVGPISRSVYLFTSAVPDNINTHFDPEAGEASVSELTVRGNVIRSNGFVFSEREHDFGRIRQSGGTVAYEFPFRYAGTEPVTVDAVVASCACTSGTLSAQKFSPGDTGILIVQFDPNLHQEPQGRFFKTVTIMTTPRLKNEPEVKIWAEIDLDLGPEFFKQKEHID
ncbi:hypothetical protein COV82_03905 [Candidatus Peregrinibacteria bacterium CG11_big_fil_rev_8_21_14_0_20_46_8]|nr:MAG: hypothetical protein COV82_03905 [Candidatus Peregrinibacteria bacterium CG11_big_fil_rev_8_21_14_0_20_46_8]